MTNEYQITNKEILDNAPEGATHYSYETDDIHAAYYKGYCNSTGNYDYMCVGDRPDVWVRYELFPGDDDEIISLSSLKSSLKSEPEITTTTTPTTPLLPCPFCGNTNIELHMDTFPRCVVCGCTHDDVIGAEAIKAWNKRVI